MAADLDITLKWSRVDHVQEKMKRQRRALEEIAAPRRCREEGGVTVLSDNDVETPTAAIQGSSFLFFFCCFLVLCSPLPCLQ
ncbi:Cysteine-rich receptor-like protein kinase 10 [Hordeum vulgare]|nr:Cysteine-rich receptor-like protein kinase 10 [Hordeum vulgare]